MGVPPCRAWLLLMCAACCSGLALTKVGQSDLNGLAPVVAHAAEGTGTVYLAGWYRSEGILASIGVSGTQISVALETHLSGMTYTTSLTAVDTFVVLGTDVGIITFQKSTLALAGRLDLASAVNGMAYHAAETLLLVAGVQNHCLGLSLASPSTPVRAAEAFTDPQRDSTSVVITKDLTGMLDVALTCSGTAVSGHILYKVIVTLPEVDIPCIAAKSGGDVTFALTSTGVVALGKPSVYVSGKGGGMTFSSRMDHTIPEGGADHMEYDRLTKRLIFLKGGTLTAYDASTPLVGLTRIASADLPLGTWNTLAVTQDKVLVAGSDGALLYAWENAPDPSPPGCTVLLQSGELCGDTPSCCDAGMNCMGRRKDEYICMSLCGGSPCAKDTPQPPDPPIQDTTAPSTSHPSTNAPASDTPATGFPETDAPLPGVTSAPATPSVAPTAAPSQGGGTEAPAVATEVPVVSGGSTPVPVTVVPEGSATAMPEGGGPVEVEGTLVPANTSEVPDVELPGPVGRVPVPVRGSVLPEGTRDVAGVAGQGATAVSPLGGRLSVVLNLKCEVEDIDLDGERPLDWEFSPTRIPLGSHRHRYFLGAVVFNIIIVVGFYFLNYGIAMVLTAGFGVPLEKALLFTRFPGMTYIAALWLMTGTTLSAANLVFDPVGTPVPVAVFGGIVLAGCIALPVVMWFKLLRPCVFRGVSIPDPKVDRVTAAQLGLAHRLLGGWKRRAYVFLYGANVWVRADGANAVYVEQYGVFFEQYRGGMHWFAVVEMSHVIVVALTSVLKPHTSLTCTLRNAFVVLVLLIYFICVMWLRPFNSRLDQLTTTTMSGSMLVAVFIMTVVLIMHGSPTAAAEPMMDVAAVCLIISAGCVFFKGAYDILLFIFDIHMERRQTAFAVSRQRCPLAFDCGAWGLSPFSSLSATPMFRDMSFDDASIELAMPLTSPEARAAPLDDLCASQMTPLADSDYDSNDPGDFNDMILIRSANVPARCGRPAALSYVSTSTDKTLPLPGSHRRHLSQELPRGRGKVKPVMRPVRSLGSLHSLSAATLLAVEQCPPQVKVLQPEVLL